jgi:hypothetical protein
VAMRESPSVSASATIATSTNRARDSRSGGSGRPHARTPPWADPRGGNTPPRWRRRRSDGSCPLGRVGSTAREGHSRRRRAARLAGDLAGASILSKQGEGVSLRELPAEWPFGPEVTRRIGDGPRIHCLVLTGDTNLE